MCNTTHRACAAAMALAVLLPARTANADTVWLKDGSIVKGEILEITDDDLKIDTDFADKISIDIDDIKSLRSSREMKLTLSDDSERTGYLRKLPDGRIYLSKKPPPDPAAAAAPEAAPAATTPPALDAAVPGDAALDLSVAGGAPSAAPGAAPAAAAVTATTAAAAAAAADADAPPTDAEVASDELLDLSSIHKMEQQKAYFWYKSDIALGVSAASGNTETANANISGAIRWQSNYTQDIVTNDYQFYHNHRLTQGVISETQFIAQTTTGLNIDFIGDLDIQLELQFDYNSDPAGGTKNEDLRYLVKLKYDFEGDQNDWFK